MNLRLVNGRVFDDLLFLDSGEIPQNKLKYIQNSDAYCCMNMSNRTPEVSFPCKQCLSEFLFSIMFGLKFKQFQTCMLHHSSQFFRVSNTREDFHTSTRRCSKLFAFLGPAKARKSADLEHV